MKSILSAILGRRFCQLYVPAVTAIAILFLILMQSDDKRVVIALVVATYSAALPQLVLLVRSMIDIAANIRDRLQLPRAVTSDPSSEDDWTFESILIAWICSFISLIFIGIARDTSGSAVAQNRYLLCWAFIPMFALPLIALVQMILLTSNNPKR